MNLGKYSSTLKCLMLYIFAFKSKTDFTFPNTRIVYKMPRNVTGGSGHKSQRNSESSKARNNRNLVDDLLSDYADIEQRKKLGMYYDEIKDVHVGRVQRRMGQGRMEVFYSQTSQDAHEGKKTIDHNIIMPLRGGLRGKGKKSVWVDPGSIVMVMETGLGGTMTHEIVAVFNEEQVSRLKKIRPNMDPRLFVAAADNPEDEGGIVFERDEEEEVDVDDI